MFAFELTDKFEKGNKDKTSSFSRIFCLLRQRMIQSLEGNGFNFNFFDTPLFVKTKLNAWSQVHEVYGGRGGGGVGDISYRKARVIPYDC